MDNDDEIFDEYYNVLMQKFTDLSKELISYKIPVQTIANFIIQWGIGIYATECPDKNWAYIAQVNFTYLLEEMGKAAKETAKGEKNE